MPANVPFADTERKRNRIPTGYLPGRGATNYASEMVTRIRSGARPHLYVREHLKDRRLSVRQLADRLDMTREYTYRAMREQHRIAYTEIPAWADAIGLDRWQDLTRPPGQPSIDARIDEIPAELRDAVLRLVGRA